MCLDFGISFTAPFSLPSLSYFLFFLFFALNLESTACAVCYVKLPKYNLFSSKPLEDYDDGHIDVLPLTSMPERKQRYDKGTSRHLFDVQTKNKPKGCAQSSTLERGKYQKNRESTKKNRAWIEKRK